MTAASSTPDKHLDNHSFLLSASSDILAAVIVAIETALRVTSTILLYATSALANLMRNGVGFIIASITATLNESLKYLAYLSAGLACFFNGIYKGFGFFIGGLLAGLNLARFYILGPTSYVMATLFQSANLIIFSPIIAGISETLTLITVLAGSAFFSSLSFIALGARNLFAAFISAVVGFAVSMQNIGAFILAASTSLVLFSKSIFAFIAGVIGEILNIFQHLAAQILAIISEIANSLGRALLALFLATTYQMLSAIVLCGTLMVAGTLSALNAISPIFSFVFGLMLEGINISRIVIGGVISTLLAGLNHIKSISGYGIGFIVGVFACLMGGGFKGFSTWYEKTVNFFKTEKTFSETFSQLFKTFFGGYEKGNQFGDWYLDAYNKTVSETPSKEIFNSIYQGVYGEKGFTLQFKNILKFIWNNYTLFNSYKSVSEKLSGKGFGESYKNNYQYVYDKLNIKDINFKSVYARFSNEKTIVENMKNAYNDFSYKGSIINVSINIGKSIIDYYTPGEVLKNVYQFFSLNQATPHSLGLKVKEVIGGEDKHQAIFEENSKPYREKCSFKDAYNYGFNAINSKTSFKDMFNKINYSFIFGSKPYFEQNAASDLINAAGLYNFSNGYKQAFVEKSSADYKTAKDSAVVICSGSGGFIAGLVFSPILTLGYLGYGISKGFEQAGIPGAAYNFFIAAPYLGISYSLRNAFYNIEKKNEQTELTSKAKEDFNYLANNAVLRFFNGSSKADNTVEKTAVSSATLAT